VNGVIDGREAIEAHPMVRMTPDHFGQAMTRTGRELMNEVVQKYARARQDAELERHKLASMIGTLRGKRDHMFLLGELPSRYNRKKKQDGSVMRLR
jgi:hypothetical protein